MRGHPNRWNGETAKELVAAGYRVVSRRSLMVARVDNPAFGPIGCTLDGCNARKSTHCGTLHDADFYRRVHSTDIIEGIPDGFLKIIPNSGHDTTGFVPTVGAVPEEQYRVAVGSYEIEKEREAAHARADEHFDSQLKHLYEKEKEPVGIRIDGLGLESPIFIADSPSAMDVALQIVEVLTCNYNYACGCDVRDGQIHLCPLCDQPEDPVRDERFTVGILEVIRHLLCVNVGQGTVRGILLPLMLDELEDNHLMMLVEEHEWEEEERLVAADEFAQFRVILGLDSRDVRVTSDTLYAELMKGT